MAESRQTSPAGCAAATARLRAFLRSNAAVHTSYLRGMRALWSVPKTGLPIPVRGGFVARRRLEGAATDQLWLFDESLDPVSALAPVVTGERLLHVLASPSGAAVACSIVRPGSDLVNWRLVDLAGGSAGEWAGEVSHPGRPVQAAWTPDSDGLIYLGVPPGTPGGLFCHPVSGGDGRGDPDVPVASVAAGDGIDDLGVDPRHRLLIYASKRTATGHRRDLVLQRWPPDGSGSDPLVVPGTSARFIGSTRAGPCLLVRRDGYEVTLVSGDWSGPDPPVPYRIWRDPDAQLVTAAYATDDMVVLASWTGTDSSVRIFDLRTERIRAIPLPSGEYVSEIAAWHGRQTVALVTSSFVSRDRFDVMPLTAARPRAVTTPVDPLSDQTELRTDVLAVPASDGTSVPVFVSGRRAVLDDRRPTALAQRRTIVVAYGGFGVPVVPRFRFAWRLWMDSGGILVVAAVRGGGERGRDWHRVATGAGKPRSFEDLRDVTAELIARGLCPTSGPVLYGQSNGGLTVAATFMKWPHLFAGLVVENALLDMVNYEQLDSDGAWPHEFGTAAEATSRRVLASYSPVDAVRHGASYPPILIVVGAADQTVNPHHSYRFAARLTDLSPATLTHLLVTPGTHGLSTPPSQLSVERAAILSFADQALAQGAGATTPGSR